jgi:Tfp pilus assembly protein PilF
MIKTTGIDFSEDRLLAIAADYLEDHNYIGALKMLNKNAQINGNAEESYMLYAETFDDMELYEK